MTTEQSCAERIDAHLEGRLYDFRALVKRMQSDDEDDRDAAFTTQNGYPLHVEVRRSVSILLSTGGPHDEFVCEVDEDGDITAIRYIFKDWFDGAEKRLSGKEFEDAEAFLRDFVEIALNSERAGQ